MVFQRFQQIFHLLRDLDALVIFQHRLTDGRPTGTLRSPGDVARGILERDVAWGTRKFGQRAGRGSMARNGHFENGFFFSDLLGEFIIRISGC